MNGHELIDAPAIIDKATTLETQIFDRVNICTSNTREKYVSSLDSVLGAADSCLNGEKASENVKFEEERVQPEKQGFFPYMFIDNFPLYSFNFKKQWFYVCLFVVTK